RSSPSSSGSYRNRANGVRDLGLRSAQLHYVRSEPATFLGGGRVGPLNQWSVRIDHWAPRSRLESPLSATAYESLLACPLQLLYVRDASFPRRRGPFARIGTAFHRALESLSSALASREIEVGIRMLLGVFYRELETQRAAASANPREARIPWPDD